MFRAHRKRSRLLRYRYMNSVNRRSPWNSDANTDGSKSNPGQQHAEDSSNSRNTSSHEEFGTGLWNKVEEMEKNLLNHLFPGIKFPSQKANARAAPAENIRSHLIPDPSPSESVSGRVSNAPSEAEATIIDPITNRRVPRASANVTKKVSSSDHLPTSFTPKFEDLDMDQPLPRSRAGGKRPFTDGPDRNGTSSSGRLSGLRDMEMKSEAKRDNMSEPNGPKASQPLGSMQQPRTSPNIINGESECGNEPGETSKCTSDDSQNYSDLEKYGPVRWNEPDGQPKISPEAASKAYNTLDQYGAVRWNEPDGLAKLTPEEESKFYKDLDTYNQPFAADEDPISSHENIQNHTIRGEPMPPSHDSSFGDLSTEEYHNLRPQYSARLNKSDDFTKPRPTEQQSTKHEDLHLYKPVKWNKPDGLPVPTPEEESKTYDDLSKHQCSRCDESEGTKHVNSNTSEHHGDIEQHKSNASDSIPAQAAGQPGFAQLNITRATDGAESEAVDHLTAEKIRADVLRRARENSRQEKLAQSKAELDEEWDTTTEHFRQNLSRTSSGRTLTGNYVRDFPEEFTQSWSVANSSSKMALHPDNAKDSGSAGAEDGKFDMTMQRDEMEISSMDESFPSESTKLEPALDRGDGRRGVRTDETSTYLDESAISEQPVVEMVGAELASDTKPQWPAIAKLSATDTSQGPAESTAEDKQLTAIQYKVLAYDPDADCITEADASSSVMAREQPATPAEVLLRLAHPSKFLVYFEPLHAEGYEIASGSGDVLIFRRAADPSRPSTTTTSITSSSSSCYPSTFSSLRSPKSASSPAINPIDMMGSPVTSSFAISPTGFVNYDTLSPDAAAKPKPDPPFRSNIGVRREEPVFSGGRQHGRDGRHKRSFGRKLVIGTLWVAGGAYSLGVLGEYFSTGGLDGLGPTRL